MANRVEHLAEGVTLHAGDCREVLREMAENSFDSCVTDPPYHLTSGNQSVDWDTLGVNPAGGGRAKKPCKTNQTGRKGGFMGKEWDGGDVAFRPDVWREVFRVLKPGAHLLSFGGTRTYHRMACAIEDAGFEIRDAVMWHYGSGFPKSRNVSKAIDEEAGAVREIIGLSARHSSKNGSRDFADGHSGFKSTEEGGNILTAPATDSARQWSGWGTALKPATEIIVLARKPLSEPTIAANVLRWGTGALNVNGCRITTEDNLNGGTYTGELRDPGEQRCLENRNRKRGIGDFVQPSGRWPANVVHDGSEEVIAAFPESGGGSFARSGFRIGGKSQTAVGLNGTKNAPDNFGDSGSAARFFYTAKADADDRLGSKHPTIKPVDLMQWLVRLITPRGGTVLDCFAGTGTTGEAAIREGMRAVLIEREPEYQEDIRRRMRLALAGPDERARESIKARGLANDPGPLFANGRGIT